MANEEDRVQSESGPRGLEMWIAVWGTGEGLGQSDLERSTTVGDSPVGPRLIQSPLTKSRAV